MYEVNQTPTVFNPSCSSSADQTKIVIAERGGVVSEGPEH